MVVVTTTAFPHLLSLVLALACLAEHGWAHIGGHHHLWDHTHHDPLNHIDIAHPKPSSGSFRASPHHGHGHGSFLDHHHYHHHRHSENDQDRHRLSRQLLATCTCDSAEVAPRCDDSGGCYTVTGGENCDDGGGPTDDLCSDCTPCGDDSISPSPTVEAENFWTKVCDTKPTQCMPGWCEDVTTPTCDSSDLASNSNAESLLLGDLAALECNPHCTESESNYCLELPNLLMTHTGSIKAAYCTGLFAVVWSTGVPGHRNTLDAIPNPPKSDDATCVVRTRADQYQVYKFPLNYSGTEGSDDMVGDSPAFWTFGGSRVPASILLERAELPLAGAIGMAANGVPIYPGLDNADYTVWEVCEGDACSSHAGKGEDYHYHGKPRATGGAERTEGWGARWGRASAKGSSKV